MLSLVTRIDFDIIGDSVLMIGLRSERAIVRLTAHRKSLEDPRRLRHRCTILVCGHARLFLIRSICVTAHTHNRRFLSDNHA